MPYIDQVTLFEAYRFDEPWDGPNNRKLASRMPRVMALSGDQPADNVITNYLAVVGPETVWRTSEATRFADIKDGPGNTILIVENQGAGVHWMEPRDHVFAEMDFKLNSPRGISSKYVDPAVAMTDTTLYRLSKDMTPATLRALLTINGGEKLTKDDKDGWHLILDGRDRPLAK